MEEIKLIKIIISYFFLFFSIVDSNDKGKFFMVNLFLFWIE